MNYQSYQLKRIFNFKLIGIGFIFLIDYNIGAVDILPDWIGLALILLGIGKVAHINSNFGSAARHIKIWLIVAAVKSILTVVELVFSVFNDSDMLLFAMIFGLADLFFSFSVFGNIVVGFDMFLNIDNQFDNAKKLGYIAPILKSFFVVKFILTLLSQLPLLLREVTYDYLSIKYNIYFSLEMVKDILTPPCFIASTLFGLFAASLFIPFCNSVSKSETLYETIKNRVNHLFLNDRFFMLMRSFNSAFGFFAVGAAFFIDFEFDKINIFPDFILFICFLYGMKILGAFYKVDKADKYNEDKSLKKLNIYMIYGLLSSIAAYIFTTAYRSESLELSGASNIIFILRIFATIFYTLSVFLFFVSALRFFESIKKFQQHHLNFSQVYLNKYITPQAKNNANIDEKQRSRLLICLGIISAAKLTSFFIGDIDSLDIGMYKFFVSVILVLFVMLTIIFLYKTKRDIYDYYN